MRKSYWYGMILLAAIALCGVAGDVEAQMHDPRGIVATGYHGVPAQPVHGNGTYRHMANGYYGVNYRHHSRVPMKYGTGPTASQLRSVTYRPYRPHCTNGYAPIHYPAHGYIQGGMYPGGAYVGGAYYGNGFYIQGGVVLR